MTVLCRWWIVIVALLSSAGWVLSALNRLDAVGYGIVLALLGIAAVMAARQQPDLRRNLRVAILKSKRRFRRPLPFLFLVMLLLSVFSGALYPLAHGDVLSYKIPRIEHWLHARHWHWIVSDDPRLNVVGVAMEWIWTPLLLLFKCDRILYLPNCIAFLFLPGLIFSVFRRLKINPRVAWYWMWLIPAGYCYVCQAGGVSNDALGTVFALAAVDFALRAWKSKRVQDLWISMLAIGVLTGLKQTNLPLVLLWIIAVAPVLKLLLDRRLGTVVVGIVTLLSSALPISYANIVHVGNWNGFQTGAGVGLESRGGAGLRSPFWGVVGNLFAIPTQNLLPPYFPLASKWNAAMEQFLKTDFGQHFQEFERFGYLQRAPAEQNAGIGLGISVFVFISTVAAWRYRERPGIRPPLTRIEKLLYVAPWIGLVAFMAKVGICQNARYLASYYPFLLVAFLHFAGQRVIIQRRWWRFIAVIVSLMSVGLLIVSRQRPLWPARTVLTALHEKSPQRHGIQTVLDSYTFYDQYLACFLSLARQIPPDEQSIGYAAKVGADEATFWKPYGHRSVQRVVLTDSLDSVRSRGIRYIVIDPTALDGPPISFDEWNKRYGSEIVSTSTFRPEPVLPPETVYLVRLPEVSTR
jgi:hypothetical protein